jgi:hypothetical protein
MQNVADVQEMEVSAAGAGVVPAAALADRMVAALDAGMVAALDAGIAAALAVATRPRVGSAISSDRLRREFRNACPPVSGWFFGHA